LPDYYYSPLASRWLAPVFFQSSSSKSDDPAGQALFDARIVGTDMSGPLRLYNTLTRSKEAFEPIDPKNVRLYVCGPTVYDYAHIGNARPVIVFDILFRLLRHIYGDAHVVYARNITDVDDKINARAAEEYPALPLNEAIRKVTEQTDRQFHDDVAALGCLPPTVEPRATEHIAEMRTLIDRLVAAGNAYVAEDNVLFSVPSMPEYGRLSKRPLDEMIAGARIDVAPYKRDPTDFVLWKPSKPGEPAWPSPAGIALPGRPGWHIECSAMSWKHLGETFDIHGGGIDLVFPHHENEIAQSRCAFHTPVMANVWMHNGFLQVEGEKMSKSLGNFVTIRELSKTESFGGRSWSGEVLRLAMLRTHYRQPIDWTVKALEEAERTLDRWYDAIGDVETDNEIAGGVTGALHDDLNTPAAVAELHRLAHPAAADTMMAGLTLAGQQPAPRLLKSSANLLGLLSQTKSERVSAAARSKSIDTARIGALLAKRTAARAAKDWAESDRIRDKLAAMDVVLKDTKDGTTWEIAR
jgi:cysteinyl-tRNA synthetase